MYGILTRYTNQNMIKLWHWGIREINLLCNFVTTAVKKGQWTQYMLNGIWAYLFISIWPLIKYYFMWPLVWYVWSDVGFDLIFNLTFFRLENWVQQSPLRWAHQQQPGFKLFILLDFQVFYSCYLGFQFIFLVENHNLVRQDMFYLFLDCCKIAKVDVMTIRHFVIFVCNCNIVYIFCLLVRKFLLFCIENFSRKSGETKSSPLANKKDGKSENFTKDEKSPEDENSSEDGRSHIHTF